MNLKSYQTPKHLYETLGNKTLDRRFVYSFGIFGGHTNKKRSDIVLSYLHLDLPSGQTQGIHRNGDRLIAAASESGIEILWRWRLAFWECGLSGRGGVWSQKY